MLAGGPLGAAFRGECKEGVLRRASQIPKFVHCDVYICIDNGASTSKESRLAAVARWKRAASSVTQDAYEKNGIILNLVLFFCTSQRTAVPAVSLQLKNTRELEPVDQATIHRHFQMSFF